MRVFVAGGTGAIGQQPVPRLVASGHEVHGMTRSESQQAMRRDLDSVPVVAAALELDQVAKAKPEVIVHQLTAIPASVDMRHFDRAFAHTQRLIGMLALDVAGGQIASVRSIVNPDELMHLGALADFTSLLRPPR